MSERSFVSWSKHAVWLSGILLLLAAPPVRAQGEDAKAHYQKATAHFAVGEYHEAAIEYEEAFKLKQDPAILFNAAQSFRLAGDNQKALLLYNNIIKLYPGTKYAKDSREHADKLAQSASAPGPTAPPPTAAPPPAPAPAPAPAAPAPISPIVSTPSPVAGAPAAISEPAAPALVATPAPAASSETDHPFYTRAWFWAGVGAVIAAGVVTAVVLSSGGGSPWNNIDPIKAGLVR